MKSDFMESTKNNLIVILVTFLALAAPEKLSAVDQISDSVDIDGRLSKIGINSEYKLAEKYIKQNPSQINDSIGNTGASLLNLVCDVHQITKEDKTKKARYDLIELLLKSGANIDSYAADGRAPIHRIAFHGNSNADILSLLINHGVNLNARTRRKKAGKMAYHGLSAIEIASSRGHFKLVETLLKNGANVSEEIELYPDRPTKTSSFHRSAILEACRNKMQDPYLEKCGQHWEYRGNNKVLSLLIAEIDDITKIQDFGKLNALHVSLKSGLPDHAKFLIKNCPELKLTDPQNKAIALGIVEKSSKFTKEQKADIKNFLDNFTK